MEDLVPGPPHQVRRRDALQASGTTRSVEPRHAGPLDIHNTFHGTGKMRFVEPMHVTPFDIRLLHASLSTLFVTGTTKKLVFLFFKVK